MATIMAANRDAVVWHIPDLGVRMTDDPGPRQGRGDRRRPRDDRWLAALVALGCGAGDPPPNPASSSTDKPRGAPAPLVSPPVEADVAPDPLVEPKPAPMAKPRTFIAEPMGTSPRLEVAEDARLFRRADDRGEWG